MWTVTSLVLVGSYMDMIKFNIKPVDAKNSGLLPVENSAKMESLVVKQTRVTETSNTYVEWARMSEMPTPENNNSSPKGRRRKGPRKWLRNHPFMQKSFESPIVKEVSSIPPSSIEKQVPSKGLKDEERTETTNYDKSVYSQLSTCSTADMESRQSFKRLKSDGRTESPNDANQSLNMAIIHKPHPSFERLKSEGRTESLSDADQSLNMAIIHRLHPDIMLNQRQADMIESRILKALDNIPFGSSNPAQFEGFEFTSGILWFLCANASTKEWLITTVLNHHWKETDIIIIDSKNVPIRTNVLVRIPEVVGLKIIKDRLARQNPSLNANEWRLLNRKVEQTEEILVFSIDGVSFSSLQQSGFSAYYGLRTIVFKHLQQGNECT